MKRILIPAAALAATAAVPAAASAAAVQTDLPCYLRSQAVNVAGQGFAPGAFVTANGSGFTSSGTADAAGNFGGQGTAPFVDSDRKSPKTVTLTASDGTNTAQASFKVVSGGAKWKGSGNPRSTVKWTFLGLTPGQPIYVHVRKGSKTIKTTRVGKAGGVCGTATKRLRRFPVRASQVRNGNYKIFVDNRKTFSRGGLQYGYTYTVFTRYRYR